MNHLSETILLVEDNEDDVFLMKRALKKSKIQNPLQVVTDGQQAIDYLSGAGEYAQRERYPLPSVVFLDLKLPYVPGFEVLSWIRHQPALDLMMVIVLTSSAVTKDHESASVLGAHSYLMKPPSPDVLQRVMQTLSRPATDQVAP